MPNHRKPTSQVRVFLGGATLVALFGAGWLISDAADDKDAPSSPSTAVTIPAPAPLPVPEHSFPAVKVVPPVVVAPPAVRPDTVSNRVETTTVSPAPTKRAPATTPQTRPATAPSSPAKPPAHSEIVTPAGTLYCNNGYQHADGTCSSTPEYPTFPAPSPSSPCSGTASQCLDVTGGLVNDISRLLGSGTP
jgi:hypothetical protein